MSAANFLTVHADNRKFEYYCTLVRRADDAPQVLLGLHESGELTDSELHLRLRQLESATERMTQIAGEQWTMLEISVLILVSRLWKLHMRVSGQTILDDYDDFHVPTLLSHATAHMQRGTVDPGNHQSQEGFRQRKITDFFHWVSVHL